MPLLTDSFPTDGVVPHEVAEAVFNAVVEGAPFSARLSPIDTERGNFVFPVVAPEGFDWAAEGQTLPVVDPNDSSVLAEVRKLAGTVELSNELVDDAAINIGALLADALVGSMAHKLDDGLLYGTGTAPNPQGLLDAGVTAAAAGDNLREAVIVAWGELVDVGANPETVKAFVKPSVAAVEFARELSGGVVHADQNRTGAGVYFGPGIEVVPVPALADADVLVADVSRTFLVRRSDFRIDISDQAAFTRDSVILRAKARYAVASPVPAKALRTAEFPVES